MSSGLTEHGEQAVAVAFTVNESTPITFANTVCTTDVDLTLIELTCPFVGVQPVTIACDALGLRTVIAALSFELGALRLPGLRAVVRRGLDRSRRCSGGRARPRARLRRSPPGAGAARGRRGRRRWRSPAMAISTTIMIVASTSTCPDSSLTLPRLPQFTVPPSLVRHLSEGDLGSGWISLVPGISSPFRAGFGARQERTRARGDRHASAGERQRCLRALRCRKPAVDADARPARPLRPPGERGDAVPAHRLRAHDVHAVPDRRRVSRRRRCACSRCARPCRRGEPSRSAGRRRRSSSRPARQPASGSHQAIQLPCSGSVGGR